MTSYAFAAGAFGASAAVASKLTVDGSGLPRLLCTWLLSDAEKCLDDHLAQSDPNYETWTNAAMVARVVSLGLFFACNAAMFALFTRALATSSSTVYVAVMSNAANFICTAVFGLVIFQEEITLRWWAGSVLIIVGVLLMHRGLAKNGKTEGGEPPASGGTKTDEKKEQ